MSGTKVLVALDVDNLKSARNLVDKLTGRVSGFKVGLELCGAEGVPAVVSEISAAGGAVFLDLKFKDIPNTVYGAVKACCRPGVFMLNVHCDGGAEMMKAAVKAADESPSRPRIIGVTVLTSIDQRMLNEEVGMPGEVAQNVVRLALLAKQSGLDGIVCSPREVMLVKEKCGAEFLTVVPGIRPVWASTGDQKRVMTPAEAAQIGADYIVIGRPITNPPGEIGSPEAAAARIMEELPPVQAPA